MPPSRNNPAKNWAFTINNYVDDDAEKLDFIFSQGHANYLVYGFEVGEEGTPHIQGYVQFKKRLRFNQVKQMVGGRAHLDEEYQNSTPVANQTYCKKDGNFREFGQLQHKAGTCPNYFRVIIDYPRF